MNRRTQPLTHAVQEHIVKLEQATSKLADPATSAEAEEAIEAALDALMAIDHYLMTPLALPDGKGRHWLH